MERWSEMRQGELLVVRQQLHRRFLRTILCGGSAALPALITGLARHGIHLLHAWGMTETSPLGSITRLKASMELLPDDEKLALPHLTPALHR